MVFTLGCPICSPLALNPQDSWRPLMPLAVMGLQPVDHPILKGHIVASSSRGNSCTHWPSRDSNKSCKSYFTWGSQ